jgi:hypothetical protein
MRRARRDAANGPKERLIHWRPRRPPAFVATRTPGALTPEEGNGVQYPRPGKEGQRGKPAALGQHFQSGDPPSGHGAGPVHRPMPDQASLADVGLDLARHQHPGIHTVRLRESGDITAQALDLAGPEADRLQRIEPAPWRDRRSRPIPEATGRG